MAACTLPGTSSSSWRHSLQQLSPTAKRNLVLDAVTKISPSYYWAVKDLRRHAKPSRKSRAASCQAGSDAETFSNLRTNERCMTGSQDSATSIAALVSSLISPRAERHTRSVEGPSGAGHVGTRAQPNEAPEKTAEDGLPLPGFVLSAGRALGAVDLRSLPTSVLCSAVVAQTSASSIFFWTPPAVAAPTVLHGGPSQELLEQTRLVQPPPSVAPLAFVDSASVAYLADPRLRDGWIVDDAHVLSAAQKKYIQAIAQSVKKETGADLVAVTQNRLIAPTTPEAVATSLFNSWAVGGAEEEKGVLVLLVNKPRSLEIHFGRGLDRVYNKEEWLTTLQRQKLVPLLILKDDVGGGLVAGVDEVADKMSRVSKVIKYEELRKAQNEEDGKYTLGVIVAAVLLFGGAELSIEHH